MTHKELNELIEKAKAATPGPYDARCREFSNHARLEVWTEYGWLDHLQRDYREKTIELMAAANPQVILDLCERVIGLQEALEKIKEPDLSNLPSASEIKRTRMAKEALERFGVKGDQK